jgi:dTDP-4-amino-4,6-dideoxygalactose transaminase
VFCDVDAAAGTIDVADARRRLTSRTRAIIPVHLFGQPADMTAINAFAKEHGLTVIEDAAQAIGARYDGARVGATSPMSCFSFYPGKNLGAAGEGGLICTPDIDLAVRLKSLRNHGQSERYRHDEVGFNYRMDGIQGLILSKKLTHIDAWTDARRSIAARYTRGLRGLPLDLPGVVHGDHVFHLYVVRTPRRDQLQNHLADQRIATGLHYPIPLHRQPCLLPHIDRDQVFPNATRWAEQGLSLPLYYGMTEAQVDRVIIEIRRFYATRD